MSASMAASGLSVQKLSARASSSIGVLTGQKLSAALEARLDRIDLARLDLRVSIEALAGSAGISVSTYRRARAGVIHEKTIRKLEAAIAALSRRLPSQAAVDPLVRATYGGFLAAFCHARGLDPAAAHAQDPRAGATGSAAWRALAHARQAAIYLTNTALSLPQRRLADALGLTPAAICLALRSVEQRRDDPDLDSLLDRLAGEIMGVMP